MSFLYPYAFFVLLAIPVLILIYLLRNKYKEVTVSSTYLWTLSQKFMKKKNPLHTFEHLIALIVQCLTIVMLAVSLAHPVFTFPGKSDNILFVVDGSASMSMEKDGKTCFEKAKEEIQTIVDQSKKGSSYSLLYVSKETRVVCENVSDKNKFSLYLSSLKTSLQKNELSDSLAKAQEIIDADRVNQCYLLTDKKAEHLSGIEWIDCSVKAENYAISDLKYSVIDRDITLTATALSYQSDKNLTVAFYINDEKIGTRRYSVLKGTPYAFQMEYKDSRNQFSDISSVKTVIEDEDTLSADNTYIVYNNEDTEVSKILLVSEDPFYLKSILSAIDKATEYKNELKVVSKENYIPTEKYDVYIFDSYTPEVLPTEGSLLFFNSETSLEGTGFVAQKTIEEENGIHLTYTNNDNSLLYQNLTKGIAHNDIVVKKYARYSLTKDFTTILTYDNLPFVFVGKSENQQREIVFAFDLHDSNLAMQYDFTPLMRNALAYLSPRVLENYSYEVDDEMMLTLSGNMESVLLKTPEGKEEKFSTNRDYITYTLSQVGTYEAVLTYEDGSEKVIRLFVRFPEEESNPEKEEEETLSLNVDTTLKSGNAVFDSILPYVILLSLLFLLDWGFYAYEQY